MNLSPFENHKTLSRAIQNPKNKEDSSLVLKNLLSRWVKSMKLDIRKQYNPSKKVVLNFENHQLQSENQLVRKKKVAYHGIEIHTKVLFLDTTIRSNDPLLLTLIILNLIQMYMSLSTKKVLNFQNQGSYLLSLPIRHNLEKNNL